MGLTGSKYDLDELQNCIDDLRKLYYTWNTNNEWGSEGSISPIEIESNQGATITEIDSINKALDKARSAYVELLKTTYKYLKKRKTIIEENEKKAEKSALGE